LGQTLALIDGKEVYSKKGVSSLFPDLEPFMMRDTDTILNNLHTINKYKDLLIEKMKVKVTIFRF
jgi:hypothetical protein